MLPENVENSNSITSQENPQDVARRSEGTAFRQAETINVGRGNPGSRQIAEPGPQPSVNQRRQGRYWMLTIPAGLWSPCLPTGCAYVKGQKETGESTAYEHWQVLCVTQKKESLGRVKSIFGVSQLHAELSRSEAADEYVWKEETRIEGTQFELGKKKHRRNSEQDWESVWELAKSGNFEDIEAATRLRIFI